MIKKIYWTLCVLSVFIWPGFCYAGPSITGVSGSIADGNPIIISGSSFGSHGLSIEWLGGANGNIEQGTSGQAFSKTNWTACSTTSSLKSPLYSTSRAHSHQKSVMSSWPLESQYDSYWAYDTKINGVGKIYVTWWVYFDHADSAGQWKMWYLRQDSSLGGQDGILNANTFYNENGSLSQALFLEACVWIDKDISQCYPNEDYSLRYLSTSVPSGRWVRLELYGKESSSAGVRDGAITYKMHKQDAKVTTLVNHVGNVITRATGVTNRWRWWIFINYWGNISSGTGTNEKVYIDDPYIQVGTQARVEIGDNSTWENCLHREIQTPTAWSNTAITATLNKGSFSPCQTYYLFVVDENGDVNSTGYPVRIVTGAGEAPCPPTGLESSN